MVSRLVSLAAPRLRFTSNSPELQLSSRDQMPKKHAWMQCEFVAFSCHEAVLRRRSVAADAWLALLRREAAN